MSSDFLTSENRLLSESLASAMQQLRTTKDQLGKQSQSDAVELMRLRATVANLERQIQHYNIEFIYQSNAQYQKIYMLETERYALTQKMYTQQVATERSTAQAHAFHGQMLDVLREILRNVREAQEIALPDMEVGVTYYTVTGDMETDETLSLLVAHASIFLTSVKALKQANRLIREKLRESLQDLKARATVLETEKTTHLHEIYELKLSLARQTAENKDLAKRAEGFESRNNTYYKDVRTLTTKLEELSVYNLKYQQQIVILEQQYQKSQKSLEELKFQTESTSKLFCKQKLENNSLKAENEQLQQKLLAFASVDQEVMLDPDECCQICCYVENDGLEQYLAEKLIQIGAY